MFFSQKQKNKKNNTLQISWHLQTLASASLFTSRLSCNTTAVFPFSSVQNEVINQSSLSSIFILYCHHVGKSRTLESFENPCKKVGHTDLVSSSVDGLLICQFIILSTRGCQWKMLMPWTQETSNTLLLLTEPRFLYQLLIQKQFTKKTKNKTSYS